MYYGKYILSLKNDFNYLLNNNDKVYLKYELSEKPSEGEVGFAKVYVNNKLVYFEHIYSTKIEKKSSIWSRIKLW